MSWQKVKIAQLGKIVTGKTPPTKIVDYFGVTYPFITPSDITDYFVRRLNTTERGLSESGKQYQKNLLIPKDSVCFVAIGSTVGKMCLTSKNSFTNQQLHSIIVNNNEYNYYYIFYRLRYEMPKLKSIADCKGAGKAILNKTEFESVEIEIHRDKLLQTKIASVLSAYDDLIENNTRRIQILEEMAQAIYKEWFVKFRIPNCELRITDEGIPEGWEMGSVGNLYEVKSGYAFKSTDLLSEGVYPIVKIKNIQNNSINISDCDFINEEIAHDAVKFELYKGDLLIAMTGAQVGKVGIMPVVKERVFLNQRVGKFSPKMDFLKNVSFIYLHAISNDFQSGINNTAAGAAQPNISGSGIENIKMIVPTNEILKMFTELMQPLFDEMMLLREKNNNLRLTRDLLLPKLMSGEVEV